MQDKKSWDHILDWCLAKGTPALHDGQGEPWIPLQTAAFICGCPSWRALHERMTRRKIVLVKHPDGLDFVRLGRLLDPPKPPKKK